MRLPCWEMRDSFVVEAGVAEDRHRLSVSLVLEADPCDMEAGSLLDLQGVGLYRYPHELSPVAALAACNEAVERQPQVARFRYQLGRAQRAISELEEAFRSFELAANDGHVRALSGMAALLFMEHINRETVAIPLDETRADELMDRGISAGDPGAMHARGRRLLLFGNTTEDRERGFELLERAAELGHTFSMNQLGSYFLDRDAPHYVPERGAAYLEISVARGDPYGHQNIALVWLEGRDGREPDYDRARYHFEQAVDGGHPYAPASLGRMIMRGQLGAVDPGAAVAFFDMGLARGDGWGGASSAQIILAGLVPGLGPADAAVRAAKAELLPAEDAAATARRVLAQIPSRELDRATQLILVELGEAIVVDGRFGPASRAALDRVRLRTGIAALIEDTPSGRLNLAARAFRAENPVRVDLF